jgi:hypothetical protein
MPKAVVANLSRTGARNGRRMRALEQRMRRPDGQIVRVVPIDLQSPTFDDDLTRIFQRNIAKARRENKKLFGSPDGPRSKK